MFTLLHMYDLLITIYCIDLIILSIIKSMIYCNMFCKELCTLNEKKTISIFTLPATSHQGVRVFRIIITPCSHVVDK